MTLLYSHLMICLCIGCQAYMTKITGDSVHLELCLSDSRTSCHGWTVMTRLYPHSATLPTFGILRRWVFACSTLVLHTLYALVNIYTLFLLYTIYCTTQPIRHPCICCTFIYDRNWYVFGFDFVVCIVRCSTAVVTAYYCIIWVIFSWKSFTFFVMLYSLPYSMCPLL